MQIAVLIDENQLIDYWGYNPVSFFSPNSSYASKKEDDDEGQLKHLIRTLHADGIRRHPGCGI